MKEIRSTVSDWHASFPNAEVGMALAGWIPESHTETIMNDDITTVWRRFKTNFADQAVLR